MTTDYIHSFKKQREEEDKREKAVQDAREAYSARYDRLFLNDGVFALLEPPLVHMITKSILEGLKYDMYMRSVRKYKNLSYMGFKYLDRGIPVDVSGTTTLTYDEAKLWYELSQESWEVSECVFDRVFTKMLIKFLAENKYIADSDWGAFFNYAHAHHPDVSISWGDWWHLKYAFGRKEARFTISIYIHELNIRLNSEATGNVIREYWPGSDT